MSRLRCFLLGVLLVHASAANAQDAKAWCANLPRPANAALPRVAVPSDWFVVYRAAEGVYAIVEPYQWQEAISYLIVGSERALLFDSGIGVARIRPVVEALTRLPVTVLNSHSHFDHVGGNWEFTKVAAMNTPFTRDNTRGHAHAGFAKEVSDSSFCHGPPAELDTATFHPRSWIATDVVRDGSRFTLGGRMLEVLHVPGHAPDALALLDRKRGLLFTGDSYYDGPIWLFGKGTDLAAFEHSITRLVALTPTLTQLLPAHNTANVSPAALSKTLAAIRAVRSGAARATAGDGDQLSFTVDGITILTSRVALRSVHRP